MHLTKFVKTKLQSLQLDITHLNLNRKSFILTYFFETYDFKKSQMV